MIPSPDLAIDDAPKGPALPIGGQHINLPGVRLWYLDSGQNAPAIVFLHANTGTSAIWEPQLAFFVAAGYRTIALDRRG